MTINYSVCKDYQKVFDLHKKIFLEDNPLFFDNVKTKSYYKTFVATQGDNIVAYCIISEIGNQAELINIGVEVQFRRLGIAKQLLTFAVDQIEANELFLEVSVDNLAAINLYKSVGFVNIDIRKKYYGDKDALIMKKTKDFVK